VFFRKKCSEAKKSELVEKILNLIAGHSHEVSILRPIKIKTFKSFWENHDYDLNKNYLKVLITSFMHAFQVIFKHDTGRVIQACVKFGSVEQRHKLFEQFKGKFSCHVTDRLNDAFMSRNCPLSRRVHLWEIKNMVIVCGRDHGHCTGPFIIGVYLQIYILYKQEMV